MTDYYAPASWEGIAEKDGYVIVVDVKRGGGPYSVLKRSGQEQEFTKSVRGDDCPHCEGSGHEPEGWTLEAARADPRGFNLDQAKREGHGGIPLFPDVLSPLHFIGNQEKCLKCHGEGHFWKNEVDRVVTWPRFQPNPPHKLWHVERDGRILDSGVGLEPCAAHDQERREAALARIVNRIEAAIQAKPTGPATAAVTETTIRRNLDKDGIEVIFPAKPDAEIRRKLGSKQKGGLGFRWSQPQELWYTRYSPALWQQVHDLLQPGESATLPEERVTLDKATSGQEPREVTIDGLTWFGGENDVDQTFWWHRDAQGRLWQAILTARETTWWGSVQTEKGECTLTTAIESTFRREQDALYGQADAGDVDPPLQLLTAMTEMIQAKADPWHRTTIERKDIPRTPAPPRPKTPQLPPVVIPGCTVQPTLFTG